MEPTTDEMHAKVASTILDRAIAKYPDSTPSDALRAYLDDGIGDRARERHQAESLLTRVAWVAQDAGLELDLALAVVRVGYAIGPLRVDQ